MNMKLLVVSGKGVIKALSKIGYYVRDQKGSHVQLRPPYQKPLTVTDHPEIAKGTIRAIIKETGLTVEEFLDLL